MITKVPGGKSAKKFDQILDDFLGQQDPHAVALDVMAEMELPQGGAQQEIKGLGFEFFGRLNDGKLELFPLSSGELEFEGNRIRLPNGWKIVLQVEPPRTVAG